MLGAGWADAARSGQVMTVANTKTIAAAIGELLVAMAGRGMPAYDGMDSVRYVGFLLAVCMKLLCLMRVVPVCVRFGIYRYRGACFGTSRFVFRVCACITWSCLLSLFIMFGSSLAWLTSSFGISFVMILLVSGDMIKGCNDSIFSYLIDSVARGISIISLSFFSVDGLDSVCDGEHGQKL
jgi:hypothetical protein